MAVHVRPDPDATPERNPYYQRGLRDGIDQTHEAVRRVLSEGHAANCSCQPCRTVQRVIAMATQRGIVASP